MDVPVRKAMSVNSLLVILYARSLRYRLYQIYLKQTYSLF